MIETVASIEPLADETLRIRKNRIEPKRLTGNEKRISIVTGIHGDELEGQYVCFELARRIGLRQEKLTGIVDIYPALNPLGIDSITRGIPAFDLDMNRLFPGHQDGNMTEFLASQIVRDLSGSVVALDIHASNIYLTEIPQIRVNKLHEQESLNWRQRRSGFYLGARGKHGAGIDACLQLKQYRHARVGGGNGCGNAYHKVLW